MWSRAEPTGSSTAQGSPAGAETRREHPAPTEHQPPFGAPGASRALISAALGGLLLLGASCSTEQSDRKTNEVAGGGRSGAGGESGTGAAGGAGGASGSSGGAASDGASGSLGNAGSGGESDAGMEVEVDADAAADDVSADAGAEAAPDAGSGDETLDAESCLFPTGLIPDGSVTSTTQDPDMTLEKFTLLCDQRGGTVYLICHCGGANTCKGLSYDFTTQTLIEHTCQGMNTCAGFTCVVP